MRAEQVEKAEGRGIHPAVRADSGHKGDGARCDQAGEDGICAVGKLAFEIKFHNVKNLRQPFQLRNISPVHIVHEWQQLAFAFQFEIGAFA